MKADCKGSAETATEAKLESRVGELHTIHAGIPHVSQLEARLIAREGDATIATLRARVAELEARAATFDNEHADHSGGATELVQATPPAATGPSEEEDDDDSPRAKLAHLTQETDEYTWRYLVEELLTAAFDRLEAARPSAETPQSEARMAKERVSRLVEENRELKANERRRTALDELATDAPRDGEG